MGSKHEVQSQTEHVRLIADADAWLQVAECHGVIDRGDRDLLRLKFEVEVPGEVPAHAGRHRVLIAEGC